MYKVKYLNVCINIVLLRFIFSANQETVVELVGFIHQLVSNSSQPQPKHPSRVDSPLQQFHSSEISKPSFYGSLAGLYTSPAAPVIESINSSMRAEVNFDFQKLTILLLRGVLKDKEIVGRKVGTAVLSHAKIEASIGKLICMYF